MTWQPGITQRQSPVLPLYLPSGDASGAEDTGQMQTLITQEGGFQLGNTLPLAKHYVLNAPLLVQEDGVALRGVGGYQYANNPPYQAGSLILKAPVFTGSFFVVAQDPALTRALAGVSVIGLGFNGGGLVDGIYLEVFKSLIRDNIFSQHLNDGIVSDQINPVFPKASYDNKFLDNRIDTCGRYGINLLGSTDNEIRGNMIAATANHGIFCQTAGAIIYGNHIYTTTYPTGYAIYCLQGQDIVIMANRCHSYQGGIQINTAGHSSGFIVIGNELQASSQLADDNLIDAIVVASTVSLVGGVIGPNTFRNTTGVASRWRYGVNCASVNISGLAIEAIVDSHDTAVASSFGTAALLSTGATVRNFNALA